MPYIRIVGRRLLLLEPLLYGFPIVSVFPHLLFQLPFQLRVEAQWVFLFLFLLHEGSQRIGILLVREAIRFDRLHRRVGHHENQGSFQEVRLASARKGFAMGPPQLPIRFGPLKFGVDQMVREPLGDLIPRGRRGELDEVFQPLSHAHDDGLWYGLRLRDGEFQQDPAEVGKRERLRLMRLGDECEEVLDQSVFQSRRKKMSESKQLIGDVPARTSFQSGVL